MFGFWAVAVDDSVVRPVVVKPLPSLFLPGCRVDADPTERRHGTLDAKDRRGRDEEDAAQTTAEGVVSRVREAQQFLAVLVAYDGDDGWLGGGGSHGARASKQGLLERSLRAG